ncbi:hypothetical protein [Vibrio atypicus]|uniref:hypothetical protein n=1 Tax=Vibrio atypicus TaxID=558271 RepID=UPI0037352D52
MREFEILEKRELYFLCLVEGMHCRIVIDEFSEDMPLGFHRLHVEEITDRYVHYGRDSVFKLTLPFAEQGCIDICTLNAGRKNNFTYRTCVKLGGKWEPILNEWVFSASVKEKVDQLYEVVHSEPKLVEVEFKETISMPGKGLSLFGFELVKGLNPNHTPIFHHGVTRKKGNISFIVSSSSKTVAVAGSVVRLYVPHLMLEDKRFREDYFAAINYRVVRQRRSRA